MIVICKGVVFVGYYIVEKQIEGQIVVDGVEKVMFVYVIFYYVYIGYIYKLYIVMVGVNV